eukprot:s1378_g10.t1
MAGIPGCGAGRQAGAPRARRPPQGRPGEPAAFGRAGRLKGGLANRPPLGEPAASREAWRAGRLRASRPPQGRPGEPAAFGRAGRVKGGLASWPPSGEPAAYCSLKAVLNFGFGLRPWGSPPAVALANF